MNHAHLSKTAAGIAAVAAGAALAAGCSVSVSAGGSGATTSAVARSTVQNEIATTLAQQLNQPVPTVTCPGNLTAKVGTVMYCSLTAQGSTTAYPVKIQVYSVSGGHVQFHITVSTTPGHFTAPS